MQSQPPARIGDPLSEVDTPALLIDLDAFDRNLARMAKHTTSAGVRLRPHAKTHKCAVIAFRQMALGAAGVCCQKVGEAEALVQAGVKDVLVSNQIVGEGKLARLAALSKQARLGVCVDHPDNIRALGKAVAKADGEIYVLVEIDVGIGRCGVPPGPAVAELAMVIATTPGLRFGGLQAYQGLAQHMVEYRERKAAIEQAVDNVSRTMGLLRQQGFDCETVSGAGTGTFQFEAASGVYTELQAGSYVFMDAAYARNRDAEGCLVGDFEHSLFVYTTVMSTPSNDRAVVDAGKKALSTDAGMPIVADHPGATYRDPSDEHGILELEAGCRFALGDKIRIIPGHCDPTVNLYDWYVGIRDAHVETLWPIVARGATR